MAGVTAAAVAVGALTVPAFVVVRDQSGSTDGAAGAGATVSAQASAFASAAVPSALPEGTKKPALVTTDKLSAVDVARIAAAQHLLGSSFSKVESDSVAVLRYGEAVGTSAIFQATTGGGTVGIRWTSVDNLPTGSASEGSGSGSGTVTSSEAPGATAKSNVVTSGEMSSGGGLQITVKVVQGAAGSTPILPGDALATFVSQLRSLTK